MTVGDRLDVLDTKGTVVRTVTVTVVTARSFHTDDNLKWSLRGMTPWGMNPPLRAVPLRYNPDTARWENLP